MARNDISDHLIHFTKGDTFEDAFAVLKKIISDAALLGSRTLIKGGYPCVCFSEAPLTSLYNGLINPEFYSRYSPFGIFIHKKWLFDLGGRPVIYEPDAEFHTLSDSHKWRHMRYEPPEIDFTWEREWRVQTDSLSFSPETASIILHNQSWLDKLIGEHESQQHYNIMHYSIFYQMSDQQYYEEYYEPFRWNVLLLQQGSLSRVSTI